MDLERRFDELRQRNEKLRKIQDELNESEVEVRSADGSATVVASPNGQVIEVRILQDLNQLDRKTLEATLVATIRAAQDAGRRVSERAIQSAIPQFSFEALLAKSRELTL
ncbi:MAG: YbaB/EbfC family nucleoid-associated protein [Micromonosporaceae bacterium]